MGCPEDIKIFPESPLSLGVGKQYASAAEVFQKNKCDQNKSQSGLHTGTGWSWTGVVRWQISYRNSHVLKPGEGYWSLEKGYGNMLPKARCSASSKVARRSTSENGYPSTAIEQTQLTLRHWLGWQEFTSTLA